MKGESSDERREKISEKSVLSGSLLKESDGLLNKQDTSSFEGIAWHTRALDACILSHY